MFKTCLQAANSTVATLNFLWAFNLMISFNGLHMTYLSNHNIRPNGKFSQELCNGNVVFKQIQVHEAGFKMEHKGLICNW
jgi:hypothetical protein